MDFRNCDIQIIIDHPACVEYLAKYPAKGEPKSMQLKDIFNSVIKSSHLDSNSNTAIKRLMMKCLGERDFSAQETMHLLLSIKLHSSTFKVLLFSLNGSRRVETFPNKENSSATSDSFLDVYAKRSIYKGNFPNILDTNFVEFATKYKMSKGKLIVRSDNIVPNIFPTHSPNPKGEYYTMYCKYQLLRYKPWKNSQNDAWGTTQPDDQTYITEWHTFLNTSYAKARVPDWNQKLSNTLENINLPHFEEIDNPQPMQPEQWMILSDFYNLDKQCNLNEISEQSCYDWNSDSLKYTIQQISEMPSWLSTSKNDFLQPSAESKKDNINSFSQMQKLAYDIVMLHFKNTHTKELLLLIINGVAGTGKSYLIDSLRVELLDKRVITGTTGKASYMIRGTTIHSLLKLPISPHSQKELSSKPLLDLQDKLSHVNYIFIDEYSMLGQTTLGWIDRQCRQLSGVKEKLFGGKSIILMGDPGQLPPVGAKPLYHAKPSNSIGEQGYYAYMMFDKVVTLSVNQSQRFTSRPNEIQRFTVTP